MIESRPPNYTLCMYMGVSAVECKPASGPLSLLLVGLLDSFVGPMTGSLHVPLPQQLQAQQFLPASREVKSKPKQHLFMIQCCQVLWSAVCQKQLMNLVVTFSFLHTVVQLLHLTVKL